MDIKSKIKMWRSETRPSIDVNFWEPSDEDQVYIDSTYKEATLLLSEEVSLSEDQLTLTRTQIWNRVPGIVSTLRDDPVLLDQSTRHLAYNDTHGITRTASQYEILDLANNVLVHGTINEY